MYTFTTETTNNGITRIVVYLDNTQVKVIRHSVKEKAIQQKDYYIRMMIGVNNYTLWLKK